MLIVFIKILKNYIIKIIPIEQIYKIIINKKIKTVLFINMFYYRLKLFFIIASDKLFLILNIHFLIIISMFRDFFQ